MQFAQLALVDFGRRLREQALRTLRFWEGDHVANRFCAGHHGDNAIQAEGDSAMWRRAVLQGIEQEAEFFLRFFSFNIQCAEDFGLYRLFVNTHRAATQFPAVEHHVVGLRHALARISFQQVFVPVLGEVKG